MVLGQGVLLTLQLSTPVTRAGLLNPHLKPEPCLSCHTKVPTKEEARAGEYFCVRDTIDATCGVCHLAHQGGKRNHPSDFDDWSHSLFSAPMTLPLYDGKITCNTCHLHRLPDEPTIYMLRKVMVREGFGPDWSELCHDCHVDY